MSIGQARRAVVVTGASSGIGQAIVFDLVEHGYRVLATVRTEEDARRLSDESKFVEPLILDVTDLPSIERAAQEADRRVGDQGLAGIVNNAGVVLAGPLEFISQEALRHTFDVNVFGVVAVTQAFLPMIRQGGGRIVNVGSVSGLLSVPFLGSYAASKFALEAVTDALRRELYPWRIHVSIVEPGNVDTPVWEKSMAKAKALEAELSPSARELYGEFMSHMYQAAEKNSRNSMRATDVALQVRHALSAARPKSRYIVGLQAKTVRLLRWLLPERAVDWLIRRELKIRRLH